MRFTITWPVKREGTLEVTGATTTADEEKMEQLFPEANIPKLFRNFNLTNMNMVTKRGSNILITKEVD